MDSFSLQNYFKRGKTVVLTLRQGDEDQVRQWSDKDTTELLKLMNVFLPEFQNQRRRKKEVWVDVAKQLQDAGYAWTPEDCRKKWSNMIRTFKGIEEQKLDPTANFKRVKWPFYDVMMEILSLKGSDSFPEAQAVVQMLTSSGVENNSGSSAGAHFARKVPFKGARMPPPRETTSFSASPHHHHLPGVSIEFLQTTQEQLGEQSQESEVDMVGVPDHTGLVDAAEVQAGSGIDADILFSEPVRYKTPVEPVPLQVESQSPSFNAYRHSLAVKKKRSLDRKRGKLAGKAASEETPEFLLKQFMDTTTKQNHTMLEKVTQFHDNALALMHERNGLLREIRDSLLADNSEAALITQACHHDVGSQEDPNDTLTLHMGPAYSTRVTSSTTNSGTASQLNSTLVLSDDTGGPALTTFQLEDGTVLSGIDTSTSKSVLGNLGSFPESGLPGVALTNIGTILHPTLVSVVSTPETSTPSLPPDMTLTLSRIKKQK